MSAGSFAIQGVGSLPNVTVAFRGEHWSDLKAGASAITPGTCIVKEDGLWRTAAAGDGALAPVAAIALRPEDVPDVNTGPGSLGPNEIENQDIAAGDWVHAYYSGSFHLTLVVPDTYEPGDLIGWDADGVRPEGKDGVGAWAKNAAADLDSIFEVQEFRPITGGGADEGILTVRALRGQF